MHNIICSDSAFIIGSAYRLGTVISSVIYFA